MNITLQAKIICIKPNTMVSATQFQTQVSKATQSILDSVESDAKALQKAGS